MNARKAFTPVTDAELDLARHDPAFRHKLLSRNMDALLVGLQKLRNTPRSGGANVKQIREGVELAVRLAELIQAAADASTGV